MNLQMQFYDSVSGGPSIMSTGPGATNGGTNRYRVSSQSKRGFNIRLAFTWCMSVTVANIATRNPAMMSDITLVVYLTSTLTCAHIRSQVSMLLSRPFVVLWEDYQYTG